MIRLFWPNIVFIVLLLNSFTSILTGGVYADSDSTQGRWPEPLGVNSIPGTEKNLIENIYSTTDQDIGTFKVLSVDHAQGSIGQYFNFNISEVDGIIGNPNWDGINVQIRNEETGQVAKAILWRASNGGSIGDGHGRWDDGTAAPWQWRAGDNITILGKGVFDVKSVDHAQGNIGKYFNFSVAEVDAIFGHTEWGGIVVQVRNNRTGKVSKAILWRSSNGGSVGDGHGRWDDGTAAPGQWMVGDKATVFP